VGVDPSQSARTARETRRSRSSGIQKSSPAPPLLMLWNVMKEGFSGRRRLSR
jgi:hypothetical protein